MMNMPNRPVRSARERNIRYLLQALTSLRALPAALAVMLLAACASMGRPEGGPRDENPPMFVASTPMPGELNVNRQKIKITFDENVNVKDIMTKVVVSPAQREMPVISSVGKSISVELRDSLRDSTTYTIDFSDAISDLNEGNILDGFSFAFSTGPTIDTLAISGMVFDARTLEPAQGMMVGVYSNLSDTAITTLPFERITKTNQLGQFTLRNLKEGTYRIYAVEDMNRDYHWDKSENVAFYDVTITPTTEPYVRTDTVLTKGGEDSLVSHPATRFLPNDIILTWYNLDYKPQYLSKYERKDRNKIYLEMGAANDSLPQLTIVGGPANGREIRSWAVLDANATCDTLEYWITDTVISALDSLRIETRYRKTDSLDRIVWQTDTLNFNMRGRGRKSDNAAKVPEKKKKGEENDSTDSVAAPKIDYLGVNIGSDSQELNRPLSILLKQPSVKFDTEAFSLSIKEKDDSIWKSVTDWKIVNPDSLRPMIWQLETEWKPGATYKLKADTGAIRGIYGNPSDSISKEFTTKKLDEYSKIYFNITGTKGRPAIVELLGTDDKPVASAPVDSTGRAILEYLNPGKYYARLYIDSNNNGRYDIGVLDSIQPEETAYFPKRINLKKNWDLEQAWDIYGTALDLQKPAAIKKNKPKRKPGESEQREDEEEEEDEFGNNFGNFGTNGNRNNGFGGNLRGNRGGMTNGRFQQSQNGMLR